MPMVLVAAAAGQVLSKCPHHLHLINSLSPSPTPSPSPSPSPFPYLTKTNSISLHHHHPRLRLGPTSISRGTTSSLFSYRKPVVVVAASINESMSFAASSYDNVLFLLSAESTGYSLASYYTSLGLFVISVPGLWSPIKRSVKSKIVQKTFIGEGEAKKPPNHMQKEILRFSAAVGDPNVGLLPQIIAPIGVVLQQLLVEATEDARVKCIDVVRRRREAHLGVGEVEDEVLPLVPNAIVLKAKE